MKTFKLTRDWSGYCRGIDEISIEADSLEEAIKKAQCYSTQGMIETDVVRDDREYCDWEEG